MVPRPTARWRGPGLHAECQALLKYLRFLLDGMPDTMIVAAFRYADLARLHALLLPYESPFTTAGEEHLRREDEAAHRTLREEIGRLLSSTDDVLADGGTL